MIRVRTGSTPTFQDRVRDYTQTHQIAIPDHIERQLVVLDSLKLQMKGADQQLATLAQRAPRMSEADDHPRRGAGDVSPVRGRARRRDAIRNAHAVQSYLGLTPGENSSSERKQHTRITKAGAMEVRRVLIQAAWAAMRSAPNEPMVRWATQIGLRRGQFIAVVALARKLAGIMFAMWRDGTTYRRCSSKEVLPA